LVRGLLGAWAEPAFGPEGQSGLFQAGGAHRRVLGTARGGRQRPAYEGRHPGGLLPHRGRAVRGQAPGSECLRPACCRLVTRQPGQCPHHALHARDALRRAERAPGLPLLVQALGQLRALGGVHEREAGESAEQMAVDDPTFLCERCFKNSHYEVVGEGAQAEEGDEEATDIDAFEEKNPRLKKISEFKAYHFSQL